MGNGVPCELDSVVHEVHRVVENKGEDEDYAFVSVDARNALYRFSRQDDRPPAAQSAVAM